MPIRRQCLVRSKHRFFVKVCIVGNEDMTELDARIPTTEPTRDELKVLVAKSDTASSYDDLLQEFIKKHAE